MKKMLALLLAALLTLAALPVLAEEDGDLPLFLIYASDESGDSRLMGCAVLYDNAATLLTVLSVVPSDQSVHAVYNGDVYDVVQGARLSADSPLVLLTLDRAADATPCTFSASIVASVLEGVTPTGLRYSAPAGQLSTTVYHSEDAMLVSARETLLPGAVLTDGAGSLAGVVVSAWGEAENRYLALTGETLSAALTSLGAENGEGFVGGFDMTWDAGLLTVDWSACEAPEGFEESSVIAYLADEANPYFSYYTPESDAQQLSMPLVPGRSYNVWVRFVRPEDELSVNLPWNLTQHFDVPDADFYAEYDFTNENYLACAPADQTLVGTEKLEPLDPVTEDALMDEHIRLYQQVINSYDVDEEMEATMMFTLETPEGYMFSSNNGFLFSPDFEANDVWNGEVTDLFSDYLQFNGTGAFAPGEYKLGYTLNEYWGGVFTFTLE